MFDVEGSVSVSVVEERNVNNSRDEKKYNTKLGWFEHLSSKLWSDSASVQTPQSLKTTKKYSPATKSLSVSLQQKGVDRRDPRESPVRLSSHKGMQEGRFKLRGGELVALTGTPNSPLHQSSDSSVISALTTDSDDESINSAMSAISFRRAKSLQQTTGNQQNRGWRRQRTPKGRSLKVREGRFKIENGKFTPMNDSPDSANESHPLDAIAEAVRQAVVKKQ